MSDYLIDQYNARIEAALEAKQNALAAATQLWHKAVDDIIGLWQAATTEAAIEMSSALEHRNRIYVEGPQVLDPPGSRSGREGVVLGVDPDEPVHDEPVHEGRT